VQSMIDVQLRSELCQVIRRIRSQGSRSPAWRDDPTRVSRRDARKETRWLPSPCRRRVSISARSIGRGNSQELLIEKLSASATTEFLLADIARARFGVSSTKPMRLGDAVTSLNAGDVDPDYQLHCPVRKRTVAHAYVYSRNGKELALLTPAVRHH